MPFLRKIDDFNVDFESVFNEKNNNFDAKNIEILDENLQKINENVIDYEKKNGDFGDAFSQIYEQKSNESLKKTATKVVAKILKSLRENNLHLLSSVYSGLENAKIVGNLLEISFVGENFKEILENRDNIALINDIIESENLKISYNYVVKEENQDVVKILKDKFNEIEIKE